MTSRYNSEEDSNSSSGYLTNQKILSIKDTQSLLANKTKKKSNSL